MRKYFLTAAVTLVMAVALTACGGNTGAGTSNDIDDAQIETSPSNDDESAIDNNKPENQDETGERTKQQTGEQVGQQTGEQTEMKMNVQIGDYNFTATLEDNEAVGELLDMMKEGPVTIQMDDYSGFEKVGSLGRSLTTSNSQTTTTAGDIVLYNGNNIVVFYGSTSWSYTRIGKIDDLSDWENALGSGSITAVFTLAE